jgi:hypothetical protein
MPQYHLIFLIIKITIEKRKGLTHFSFGGVHKQEEKRKD